MADDFTPNINLRKPEVGAAEDTWGGIAGLNGDMDLIDAIFLATGLGTSVGLHVGTGKVLNARDGTAYFTDDRLEIQDGTDATKILKLDAGDVTTATTATFKTPAASDTLVGLAAAQKLLNKTATTEPIADNSEKLATTEFVNQILAAAGLSLFSTGDVKMTFKIVADAGWLLMLDYPIGNAASGAAHANPNCEALFKLIWNNVIDFFAPVLPGGRGASAAADWTANKTIMLPRVLGRALAGGGSFGTGSGLSTRTLGQTVGEENHTLTVPEMPSHDHTIHAWGNGAPLGVLDSGSNNNVTLLYSTLTGSQGGGGGHNNMQPTTFLNVMIKL